MYSLSGRTLCSVCVRIYVLRITPRGSLWVLHKQIGAGVRLYFESRSDATWGGGTQLGGRGTRRNAAQLIGIKLLLWPLAFENLQQFCRLREEFSLGQGISIARTIPMFDGKYCVPQVSSCNPAHLCIKHQALKIDPTKKRCRALGIDNAGHYLTPEPCVSFAHLSWRFAR